MSEQKPWDFMKFKIGVIPALMEFKHTCKYNTGEGARMTGMWRLVQTLSEIYGIPCPTLLFTTTADMEHSFLSYYRPEDHTINIVGKLSIITLLHEFAHALGKNQAEAQKWSISLFRRCYPKAFETLSPTVNGCLIQEQIVDAVMVPDTLLLTQGGQNG